MVPDTPGTFDALDIIFAHNRERWGGRCNPLIVTDGQSLTPTWWSVLESVDPDVVRSLIPLRDLTNDIQRRVAPDLIAGRATRGGDVYLETDALNIWPTARNVRRASWAAMRESTLALFTTTRDMTEPGLKRSNGITAMT